MSRVNDGCIMVGHVDIKGHDAIKRVYSSDGIAPALTTMGGGHREPKVAIPNDYITEGERNMTQTNEITYEGMPFTYVSLFSGIGGFETALNRLGGNCVLASEIDKFANQSYEALYGHPTAGDITQIQAEDVPDHDVLVGGFPCQAFSVAGKRLGFDDTRGTLFFEVARLAKTKQPRAILLENVKGLVGHDGGKTLDVIVQTLNDIGYHVDFNVLNSKYFGVPQNRERIFIVALRDDIVEPADWIIEGTNVVAKGKRRIASYDGTKTFNFDWTEQTKVTTRLRDVLESTVDERYYLSEEKTSKLLAQLDAKDKIAGSVGHHPFSKMKEFNGYNSEISPCLIATDYKAPKTVLEDGLPIREATKQGYAMAAVGDAVNFQFPDSNTRRGRGAVGPKINVLGNIKPPEATRHGQRDDVYGTDGLMGAINASDYKQPRPIYGDVTSYRIRKLTPLECWRLQGFTDEQHQTVVDAGLSDSQRYKQAGNAVTVNVIQAIGERLLTYI